MDELTPWWTISGVWPRTRERWCGHFQALEPRVAEDMAQQMARDRGGELWVTGVFAGKLKAADLEYATFVDPDQVPVDDDQLVSQPARRRRGWFGRG